MNFKPDKQQEWDKVIKVPVTIARHRTTMKQLTANQFLCKHSFKKSLI